MKLASTASTAMRKENSLICPSLKPTSRAMARFSLAWANSFANTRGLRVRAQAANRLAGSRISPITSMLKEAPREKKKVIRKKSRKGFKRSVMNRAMGLDANTTPAMNAPIS